tara:strand:+ start:738 stop:998 length:261 start_codon:yes stop_codon:yes gene_type:complete
MATTNPRDFINAVIVISELGYHHFISENEIQMVQNNPQVTKAVLEEIIENNITICKLKEKLEKREKELNEWTNCILGLQKHIDLNE